MPKSSPPAHPRRETARLVGGIAAVVTVLVVVLGTVTLGAGVDSTWTALTTGLVLVLAWMGIHRLWLAYTAGEIATRSLWDVLLH